MGETFLVVLGILIALQINNWNEYKKDRKKEKEVLLVLLETIAFNNTVFEEGIKSTERYNAFSDYVIDVLEKRIPYSDSVEQVLNRAIFKNKPEYSKIGYEYLKNAGFDIIINDSLKKEIILLFEDVYIRIDKASDWGSDDNQPEYFDHHFLPIGTDNELYWRPFDWEVQMNDPYFRSIMYKVKAQREYYALIMERVIRESQPVYQYLNEELDKRK